VKLFFRCSGALKSFVSVLWWGKRDRKSPCRPTPIKALVNHSPHRVRTGVHHPRSDAFPQHPPYNSPDRSCLSGISSEKRNYTQPLSVCATVFLLHEFQLRETAYRNLQVPFLCGIWRNPLSFPEPIGLCSSYEHRRPYDSL